MEEEVSMGTVAKIANVAGRTVIGGVMLTLAGLIGTAGYSAATGDLLWSREPSLADFPAEARPSYLFDKMVTKNEKAFEKAFPGLAIEVVAGGGGWGMWNDEKGISARASFAIGMTGAEALYGRKPGGTCEVDAGNPDLDVHAWMNPPIKGRPVLETDLWGSHLAFDEFVAVHEFAHCADILWNGSRTRELAKVDTLEREMTADVYASLHHLAKGRSPKALEMVAMWRHLNYRYGWSNGGGEVRISRDHWTSPAILKAVSDAAEGRIVPNGMSKQEKLDYARSVAKSYMAYLPDGSKSVDDSNALVQWMDKVLTKEIKVAYGS